MTELPRLKPLPIPEIHPIPEYAATGALAETFACIKQGLGMPWMGVIAMCLAAFTPDQSVSQQIGSMLYEV